MQCEINGVLRQADIAVLEPDHPGYAGANVAVGVLDSIFKLHLALSVKRVFRIDGDLIIQ